MRPRSAHREEWHLGLIGWPLAFSLSPVIHEAALRQHGLKGWYRLFPIAPGPGLEQKLQTLIEGLRTGELHGLNVTVPHKEAIVPLVDDRTPLASEIGAVNTLFVESGRVWGHNTDADGFLTDLRRWGRAIGRHWENGGRALLLGAGGACRGAAYALVRAGWEVILAARRLEQADALAEWLNRRPGLSGRASAARLSAEALRAVGPVDVIVNTTPVGMGADQDRSPWPKAAPWPPGAAVYDMIYHPSETVLMREAAAAGLAATNGLGMLIEQGALAFERWTGRPVERSEIWRACGC